MNTDIITYKDRNEMSIKLSHAVIRQSLVRGAGNVTDQEVEIFLQLCRYQRLNPWLNEAYLIKYGSSPAQCITSKDVFFKRASSHDQFDGIESGVYTQTADGLLQQRQGAFFLPGERLVGGWSKVYRKDRSHPSESHVRLDEYVGRKRDGSVNGQWAGKPGTMIVKVAESQALRKAFPDELGALYDEAEMGVDNENPGSINVTPPHGPAATDGRRADKNAQDETPADREAFIALLESIKRDLDARAERGELDACKMSGCLQFLSPAKNEAMLRAGWEKLQKILLKERGTNPEQHEPNNQEEVF